MKSIPKHIKQELSVIAKAKKDKRHFAPLYDIYYKQIFLYIFKKVKNEDLTSDLCSKTFMKAMVNLHQYTYKGFPFSSWLYRIASNEVNMHYRKTNKVQQVQILEKDVFTLIETFEVDEKAIDVNQLLEALANLKQEQSDLIDLRFFEGLSFKEIASIFNLSEASAKMKIYRILEKLKKELLSNNTAS